MLRVIIHGSVVCFGSALPLLLLFEVLIYYKVRKSEERFNWLHFVLNLDFIFLLTVMLFITGIPSFYRLGDYGNLTSAGLRVPSSELNFIPFHNFAVDYRPYLENIVFFVPFGFLLPLLWEKFRSPWKTVLLGFLFSCIIEFSQLFDYRVTDIDDLIMNTLGAFAGWLIWHTLKIYLNRFYKKAVVPRGTEHLAFLLSHETLFDLAAAFLGMFFLFRPIR